MKSSSLCLSFFLLVLAVSTFAKKSPITDISIARLQNDLYVYDTSPIILKLTRENGRLEYTQSFDGGYFKWNKINIESDEAEVSNGVLKTKKYGLIASNYVITMNVQIIENKDTYRQVLVYKLPPIEKITIPITTLIPYSATQKSIKISTEAKSYTLNHKSTYKNLDYYDFKWIFMDEVQHDPQQYIYNPKAYDTAQSTTLTVQNSKLQYRGDFVIPIQQLKKLAFSYPPNKGVDGENGENGANGDTGENGGHGGGGWHGGDGYDGLSIEILVTESSKFELEVAIFHNGKVDTYNLPRNSKISLAARGGNGGSGGEGGKGGSGGDSSDDYEAGSTGTGGPGGNGGVGGIGGHISIFSNLSISQLANIFDLDVAGGNGGSGGKGGYGSPSGNGGKVGKNGKPGRIEYIILDTAEILDMHRKLVRNQD
jgi:hypothetical protein